MRLLDRFWNLGLGPDRLVGLAKSLGADVPACIRSVTARGEGRGDRVEPVAATGLTGTPVLLVNPRQALSTAPVFQGWAGTARRPPPADWQAGRKQPEPVARAMVREINKTQK